MANNIMAYHVAGNVHEKFAGKKVCTKMTSRIFIFIYTNLPHRAMYYLVTVLILTFLNVIKVCTFLESFIFETIGILPYQFKGRFI